MKTEISFSISTSMYTQPRRCTRWQRRLKQRNTKDLRFTPNRRVLVSDWLSFSTRGRRGVARAGGKQNGNPLSQSARSRHCLMLIDAVAAGTPLLGCHTADSQSLSHAQARTHITEVSYGSFFCGSSAVTAEKLLHSQRSSYTPGFAIPFRRVGD